MKDETRDLCVKGNMGGMKKEDRGEERDEWNWERRGNGEKDAGNVEMKGKKMERRSMERRKEKKERGKS